MNFRHLASFLVVTSFTLFVSCGDPGDQPGEATGKAEQATPPMTPAVDTADISLRNDDPLDSLAGTPLSGAREESFLNVAKDVVNKLAHRDSIGLAQYIHPETGLYLTYSVGVRSIFHRYSTLGFGVDEYPLAPFYDGVRLGRLVFAKPPTYNCENWSREGTFSDSTRHDSTLTRLAVFENHYFEGRIPTDSIGKLRKLELLTRRVVIASNTGESLLFSLSLIDHRWWLTIIDKSSTDCSA